MHKTTLTFIILLIISQTGTTAQAHEVTSCGITEIIKTEQTTIPENYIAGNPINIDYSFTTLNNTPVQIVTNILQDEIGIGEWIVAVTIDNKELIVQEENAGNFTSEEIVLTVGTHDTLIRITSLPYILPAEYVISSVLASTPCTTINHSHESQTTGTSSGSGGFGVISNEPLPNIEISETVERDLHINITTVYNFNKTSIYEIVITPTRNEDEVMIKIENLKGISSKVDTPPSGEVFKYTNIYFGSNYIKSATVRFKLDSSLTSDKNINLVYWNGKSWETLTTTLIGTDDKYYYYETIISSLSRFSIVGVNVETSVPTSTPEVILDIVPVVTPIPTESQQSPITVKSPGFDMLIAFISIIVISVILRKKI